jgi:hypothetical protein
VKLDAMKLGNAAELVRKGAVASDVDRATLHPIVGIPCQN